PEVRDLPPTLRSIWLVFHVFFNKLAVAAFVLSVASAVTLHRKLRGQRGPWLDRLPSAEALEAYCVRFVGFGLVFWATTIVAGAIWANQSWGRYWGWDVIETWSLITLLSYATLLHVSRFFGVRGERLVWWTLGCFGVSVLTIFILPFAMPSLHAAYFQ
ncbi:MAG: cytochrome c biogenesis protein CcsA, partial [Deltaproteobacteria bacterium]|nr:cytochrome c biogenesis protein CcsA [Deltaproteobacteria bacterium]